MIIEQEVNKSRIDTKALESLIKPSTVMFDPLQKSNLIGFLTTKDQFLN